MDSIIFWYLLLLHIFSQFSIPLFISVYFTKETGLDVFIQNAIILESALISLLNFFLDNNELVSISIIYFILSYP